MEFGSLLSCSEEHFHFHVTYYRLTNDYQENKYVYEYVPPMSWLVCGTGNGRPSHKRQSTRNSSRDKT
jgi:hypothetical protein